MMKKETEEEYLETLYKLYKDSKEDKIKTGEIADHLGVSPPTVTEVLPMLEEKGYLEYIPYYGVKLSDKGHKEGERIVRSHRVLEVFLFRYFSLEHEILHEKACQLEHIFNSEMIDILCDKLGRPKRCPHGNEIPTCGQNCCSKD